MRIDDFDYKLPPRLIAQEPLPQRDLSRLLVVRRDTQTIDHHVFRDLPDLLRAGDLLVLNDTKVVPARLVGRRARTGGRWEGLFLGLTSDGSWKLMGQTRGRLAEGEIIIIEPGPLRLRLIQKQPSGAWLAEPNCDPNESPYQILERHGQTPLPPYIRKGVASQIDRDRYQTVYATKSGAVAAPTAGLHFTRHVLDRLSHHGIENTFVTLHVGPGTFRPVQVEDIRDHEMHAEWGAISAENADFINARIASKRRIVAVGTTTVRVLESAVGNTGLVQPGSGEIDLYIYPPYQFRVVSALLTNFHLPRSSLLVLVSAFAGLDLIRRAYQIAIDKEYRFYSYGDAMLIL
jgi:S-adenosylmethionine:tRNA ribosyltransferase-isomerase